MAIFTFRAEPSGAVYELLFRLAGDVCASGYLIVRPEDTLSPAGRTLLAELHGAASAAQEWPGTRLLPPSEPATRYDFPLTPNAVRLLTKATLRLFGWLQPALPEDLGLVRGCGAPWLTTISHERDAWLTIDANEHAELPGQVKGLLRAGDGVKLPHREW